MILMSFFMCMAIAVILLLLQKYQYEFRNFLNGKKYDFKLNFHDLDCNPKEAIRIIKLFFQLSFLKQTMCIVAIIYGIYGIYFILNKCLNRQEHIR